MIFNKNAAKEIIKSLSLYYGQLTNNNNLENNKHRTLEEKVKFIEKRDHALSFVKPFQNPYQ